MINVPFDIGSHVNTTKGGVPASAIASATTVNGTGFDRTGFLSCVLAVNVGAVTGTPATATVAAKIQDSADNSTFADFVPNTGAASIAAQDVHTAGGFFAVNVNLLGARQYIRAAITTTLSGGSSPTIPAGAAIVCGGAITEPA